MSRTPDYDVIVIGAGSVGTPLAMSLTSAGLKTLCIDREASAGQGNNKCAIGGTRATHTEPAKVALALRSLEVFRHWERDYGDDIGWRQGGYMYVAYDDERMELFEKNVPEQRQTGLDIRLVSADRIAALAPGINPAGLLGGTWSPEDGSCSPMLACYAFWQRAEALGAEFRFGENVLSIQRAGGLVSSVVTDAGEYACSAVVNCAGSFAVEVGRMAGIEHPVSPDSHEAGITEPVQRLFEPMIVDIRKAPGSANYYFYQHDTGQVIFCITPDPPIPGIATEETSSFLPLVAPRMVDLYPRLANLKVRRVWRGVYPMSPDGSPILGSDYEGYFFAVGMCGQGLMLGPGIGEVLTRFITDRMSETDRMVMHELRADREFCSVEALK